MHYALLPIIKTFSGATVQELIIWWTPTKMWYRSQYSGGHLPPVVQQCEQQYLTPSRLGTAHIFQDKFLLIWYQYSSQFLHKMDSFTTSLSRDFPLNNSTNIIHPKFFVTLNCKPLILQFSCDSCSACLRVGTIAALPTLQSQPKTTQGNINACLIQC